MLPTQTTAEETDVKNIFNKMALENPRFAVSASYAVARNEPVVMTAGPTIKGGKVDAADNARWHIGSISKSFTSTLVMRLVERGMLSLDEPIERYLPAYREKMHPDWKTPNLRQLLSHTAGLPANASHSLLLKTYGEDPKQGRRKVLEAMWAKPVDGKVGNFAYSNIGYVLAGLIVEEAMGVSWEEAILSEIAEPLGLSSLGFGAPKGAHDPRGHQNLLVYKRPIEPSDVHSDNPAWMGPAGTIHLSMTDLSKWGQIHISACKGLRPDFLSQSSCQEMQSPISDDYGLGWMIDASEKAGTLIWHNGSNSMWYALLYIMPAKDISIAVATNVYSPKKLDKLARDLSAALVKGTR